MIGRLWTITPPGTARRRTRSRSEEDGLQRPLEEHAIEENDTFTPPVLLLFRNGAGNGRWIRDHLNCLITGPAGVGKSWISCALAHSACRNGYSAAYRRLPRLLTELAIARADARYAKLLASIAKTNVLVIDDWGVSKLSAENRRDLLEIIEDRHGLSSTIVTSQLPVENWHAVIGDPTLADAILDRLVHNAYQLNLKGESMRKTRGPFTQSDHLDS